MMKTTHLFMVALSAALLVTTTYATFSTPVPVSIDTSNRVNVSSISQDELTIYYLMITSGSQYDVYYSTRPDKSSPFSAPIAITSVNTSLMEWGPDISADDLSLYFARGTNWNGDIWIASRASVLDPFGAPQAVAEVNTSDGEAGPSISADGLTLYFGSNRLNQRDDLFYATRSDVNSPFGAAIAISELNTAQQDYSPSITTDGLTLYYVFRDDDSGTPQEIWTASRPNLNSPFSTPHRVEELYIAGVDTWGPDISYDGKTLYFTSLREGSLPGNLWMATVIPEPSLTLLLLISSLGLVIKKFRR
jgi:Tol biopolymer transport system component